MKLSTRTKESLFSELAWSYGGLPHRVTTWPDVRFERREADGWTVIEPDEAIFAAAAVRLNEGNWNCFLEFFPAAIRDFLRVFKYGRIAALQVASECPALLPALMETPALTPFLSAHARLRGTGDARWVEISAVHERSGIFGLLEWLGLPASRQTLAALRNVLDPDLPRRLIEPLRAVLWEPETVVILQRSPRLTDRQLTRFCHPLAA